MTKRWTEREDDILGEYYPEHGESWIAWPIILPGRTENAIRERYHALYGKAAQRKGQKMQMRQSRLDPREQSVMDAMCSGFPPSEIDKMMKWWPGTSRRILVHIWAEDSDRGE